MNLPTIAQGNLRAQVMPVCGYSAGGGRLAGHAPAAVRLGLNGANSPCSGNRARRRGFTLIEMLVSLAITLIMMGAVVTLFGVISESVANSRTAIEMADRLRAARDVIQNDLVGATATFKPPLRPENNEGYFEIIEGWLDDKRHSSFAGTSNLFGDIDDVLMFTTRNRKSPFLGKATPAGGSSTIIESPEAEVVYFLVQDGPIIDATTATPNKLCTLYRRTFLIAPSVGNFPNPPVATHMENNDVSARFETIATVPTMVPNTLGDLTKRENRFAHFGPGTGTYATFPFLVDTAISPKMPFVAPTAPTRHVPWPTGRPEDNTLLQPFADSRLGDDVLLTNVLAFDVRVWDPNAPVVIVNGVATEPGDPMWNSSPGATIGSLGAYVDLGYQDGGSALSVFDDANTTRYPLASFPSLGDDPRVYDTWSLHYENDGVNQDNVNGADDSTNGLDDDANGLVDDNAERDTVAPYSAPLRGIRVTIRVYEPNSKQVREAVVIQNFDTK